MKLKKILVPVDGSAASRNAARYAASLAEAYGAQVVLLHAFGPLPMLLEGSGRQAVADELRSEAEAMLEEFRSVMRKKGVAFETRIVESSPGRAILNIVMAETCCMVVMGSRGYTDLEGIFVGSVAHEVLHSVPCPVLIVRELDERYLAD